MADVLSQGWARRNLPHGDMKINRSHKSMYFIYSNNYYSWTYFGASFIAMFSRIVLIISLFGLKFTRSIFLCSILLFEIKMVTPGFLLTLPLTFLHIFYIVSPSMLVSFIGRLFLKTVPNEPGRASWQSSPTIKIPATRPTSPTRCSIMLHALG